MDEETEQTLKSLVGHHIVRVEVRDDGVVELGVPESEGWHVVLSAGIGSDDMPELRARWEPGLPHHAPPTALRCVAARVAHPRSR